MIFFVADTIEYDVKIMPLNVNKKNFSYKKSLKTPDILIKFTGPTTRGWGQSTPTHPSFFCVAERKKGKQRKKERASKQKLLKGCHQGQNVTVLAILERLEFKNFPCRPNGGQQYFSVFHGPSTLKFFSSALIHRKKLKHELLLR